MNLREKVARLMCAGLDQPACDPCLDGASEILDAVFDHLEQMTPAARDAPQPGSEPTCPAVSGEGSMHARQHPPATPDRS